MERDEDLKWVGDKEPTKADSRNCDTCGLLGDERACRKCRLEYCWINRRKVGAHHA